MARTANSHSRHGLRTRAAAPAQGHPCDRTSGAFHVAGVVVHALPSAHESVSRAVAAIPGARVHAANAAGKLVVTLEGGATGTIVAGLESIRRISGVIDASLVYQHGEDDANDEPEQAQGGSP